MKKILFAIKLILILVSSFLLFNFSVKAVDNPRITDMRSLGMGIRGVTESAYSNPAALSFTSRKEISATYYNRFMLREMGTTCISLICPLGNFHASIRFSTFGDATYRDSETHFSLSRKIGKRWSAGINIVCRFLQIKGMEGAPAFVSTDFGVVYQPVDNIKTGVVLQQVPSFSIGKIALSGFTGYSLRWGSSWQIIPSVLLAGEMEVNYEIPLSGSVGAEYFPFPAFAVRIGVATDPLQPYMGIGCRYKCFTADLAFHYHPVLGISAGAGLKFCF